MTDDKMREAFEAWASLRMPPGALERRGESYALPTVDSSWFVWQAATAYQIEARRAEEAVKKAAT